MTITPVRLAQEGEPARHPSVQNRAMQDVLFGSDYLPDGSDFEGFAKKRNVPTPPDFERTIVLPFGDGVGMSTAGAVRFGSVGLNYVIVGWRLRSFDSAGNPTPCTCVMAVDRIAWSDDAFDMIGSGTAPTLTAATKAVGNPDDWELGEGLDGDYIRAKLVSVTPMSSVYLVLTIDFQPA
jgi:hypothetical protein